MIKKLFAFIIKNTKKTRKIANHQKIHYLCIFIDIAFNHHDMNMIVKTKEKKWTRRRSEETFMLKIFENEIMLYR